MNQGRFEQDNRRGGRRDSQDFENDQIRPSFGEDQHGSRQYSDQDERYRSGSSGSESGYGQSSRGGSMGERGMPRGRDFDDDRSGLRSTEFGDYSGSQGYREGRSSQYGHGFQGSGREFGGYGGRQGTSGDAGRGNGGYQGGRFGSSSWGGRSESDSGSAATGRWGRGGNLSGRQGNQQGFQGRGPKGYQRSDERIREDVSDRLTDDDSIDASEITVQVQTGEVTLSGTVDDREQKRRAEDLAEQISGVREVINNLRISRQWGSEQQSSSGDGRGDRKDGSKTSGKTGAVS